MAKCPCKLLGEGVASASVAVQANEHVVLLQSCCGHVEALLRTYCVCPIPAAMNFTGSHWAAKPALGALKQAGEGEKTATNRTGTRGRMQMMTEKYNTTLIRLADTELTVADPAEDVRGKKVLDRNGKDVGQVDDILIDEQEKRARFLQVGSGGFLGIGEAKRLVPVDAVTTVDEAVRIDTTKETVADSVVYDPDIAPEAEFYVRVYEHYGYTPSWGFGYPRDPNPR